VRWRGRPTTRLSAWFLRARWDGERRRTPPSGDSTHQGRQALRHDRRPGSLALDCSVAEAVGRDEVIAPIVAAVRSRHGAQTRAPDRLSRLTTNESASTCKRSSTILPSRNGKPLENSPITRRLHVEVNLGGKRLCGCQVPHQHSRSSSPAKDGAFSRHTSLLPSGVEAARWRPSLIPQARRHNPECIRCTGRAPVDRHTLTSEDGYRPRGPYQRSWARF